MTTNGSGLCFGLVLLLEAAEYHNANMAAPVTPLNPHCDKKRDIGTSSSPQSAPTYPAKSINSESISFSLPLKKRTKRKVRNGINGLDGAWLRSNHRSPLKAMKFSPIKKSNKCSGGSAHRMWEQANECDMAATAPRRFDHTNIVGIIERQDVDDDATVVGTTEADKSFILYDKDDDQHINAVHNIVRRDIWEGFVVNASKDATEAGCFEEESPNEARRSGRIARYDGTIGFRCRFCKSSPFCERAEKSVVYPRSLERIYLANIRFQRDHIQ
mmetsp:Transcript_22742/g.47448  ORF Transcript_22742/g.47448 Transcript_22742/m.47448 type:complete len:272 (-) Transcript_22742:39-854(-)